MSRRPSNEGGRPSVKQGLQTAVRSLKPQELFALTAENERLIKLEKELAAREAALNLREVSVQEDLTAREAALAQREAAQGGGSSGGGSSSSASHDDFSRMQAQNEELRRALDLAMLNGGGGGVDPSVVAALKQQVQESEARVGELTRTLQESEARHLLERSESQSRVERAKLAFEHEELSHGATSAKLKHMTTAHEHATALLKDLQAALDEANAARSAAERERDRLADVLARHMLEGNSNSSGGGNSDDGAAANAAAASGMEEPLLPLHVQLLQAELAAAEEAGSAMAAAVRVRWDEAEVGHAAAREASERELAKAVAQVHAHVEQARMEATASEVLRGEIGVLETTLALGAEREAAQHKAHAEAMKKAMAAREKERQRAEAAAAEAAAAGKAAAAAEAACADATERAARSHALYEEAELKLMAAKDAMASLASAKKRLAALEKELAKARAEGERSAKEVARLDGAMSALQTRHEDALRAQAAKAKEMAKMREAVLKEAVERAEAARRELAELQGALDEAAADEERAREGEELALGQVARLEKQLEAAKRDIERRDDSLQAMARRLEVLAQANTESHMTDVGYWGERAKRSDFATAAFTVGSSKRQAHKVAQAAMRRAKVLDGAPGGPAASSNALPSIADATATSSSKKQTTTTLPPLKKAAVA